MPIYEYECQECEHITEVIHSFSESPSVVCEECGSEETQRIISTCSIKTSHGVHSQVIDQQKRREEMQVDLRENYGVHDMKPMGKNFEGTYQDIKESGSLVKDQMQAQREANQKKQAQKDKERREKSKQTRAERVKAIKERRAKEDFKKRSLGTVTTKKGKKA